MKGNIFLVLLLLAASVVAQETGFLSGWYTSGNYVVCEYTSSQGVYAIMIDAYEVCPVTIEIGSE